MRGVNRTTRARPGEDRPDDPFVRRLLLTVGVAAGVVLLARLADVLLLAFGALLVAVLLHAIAEPLRRRTPLGPRTCLALSVLIVGLAASAAVWAFGRELEAQLAALAEMLPRAWAQFTAMLSRSPLGGYLLAELDAVPAPQGGWLTLAPKLAFDAASGLAATVIVIFGGLYLGFHPGAYADGLRRLLPPSTRARAAVVFDEINDALRRWLLGQLLSMVVVGTTTAAGLWLVGAPSPIGLGVLAGLGQFVPVVGPIAAAIPGLLVAATAGPQTLALTGVVYLASTQFEANVLTPLVLRRMAEVPMAVTLFAVLAMGVLFGPLGALFATPLAVTAHVLVRRVYIEDVLGDRPPTSEAA